MSDRFLQLSGWLQLILIYAVSINIITFFYFGIDKLRSQLTDARRVRERTLWILAGIGGSVGALLGMWFFRHKTKKTAFQLWIVLIILLQLISIFLWMS